MATRSDIECLYSWVHTFHTLRSGEYADFSCAFFNGNFNMTLPEAQEAKHQWVLDGLGFEAGDAILDVGCGWGPILNAVRTRRGKGVGLTLSSAQAAYCKDRGLNVFLQDWRTVERSTLPLFDGVASIGAFEHFCSIDEFRQGQQEQIYRDFFAFCAYVLPAGGRLFLQTMTWGKEKPDPRRLNLHAPEGSPEQILARLSKYYPGSWLPASKDQIVAAAKAHFHFLYSNNGRLDYIETLNRWDTETHNLYKPWQFPKALWVAVRLIPRFCMDPDFRIQIESRRCNDQQVCFLREIMSHERMFFEKR
jgi:cyclopropane-fatty-acyl-phospholipid synthase